MSKNKELTIKSRLLFNSLDMNYKLMLTTSQNIQKRKKALDVILSTYRMTITPFIKDEEKDYQDKIYNAISRKYDVVSKHIEDNDVKDIEKEMSPVLEDLKNMVRTCKTNLDNVNRLWYI